jgi:protein-L-isoaspartate(D-aspartate) O-methyltransferase
MMDDYNVLIENMIRYQLMNRGIKDERVLDAMRSVPRHIFVPSRYKEQAYEDKPLPSLKGQTISQPYIVALMTELLRLKEKDKVLEIGTGTGYHTAIIARIADFVYSVERIPELVELARSNLNMLGIRNVEIFLRDGTEGLDEYAPYDKIIIEAAVSSIPKPLLEQLKDGGLLVAPIGDRYLQKLAVFKKRGGRVEREDSISCAFVPLIGKYGFKE